MAKRFIKKSLNINNQILFRVREKISSVLYATVHRQCYGCVAQKNVKSLSIKVGSNFQESVFGQELGYGCAQEVYPEGFQHYLDTYSSAFDARSYFRMEYLIKRTDGEYRWILATGTPYYLAGGNFGGYIGSCVDIQRTQGIGEEAS